MRVDFALPLPGVTAAGENVQLKPATTLQESETGLSKLPAFAHADPETAYGLLDEFGRFVSEVLAPIDRGGDTQGAKYDPTTGAVTTAPGWKDAYRRYVDAGWGSVPFEPEPQSTPSLSISPPRSPMTSFGTA